MIALKIIVIALAIYGAISLVQLIARKSAEGKAQPAEEPKAEEVKEEPKPVKTNPMVRDFDN